MTGNQVVYLHVWYLIFDHNQQFETIEPIRSEVAQAGVINYTIKFHTEVSSDDPANIGGGGAIHVFLPVQNANHLNGEIIAGPPQICAGPACPL